MTSLDELRQSILGEAKARALQIEREAQAEVVRITQETERMLHARKERLHLDAESAQHAHILQLQAKKRLAAHRKVLEEKQAVIDTVFANAAQAIATLPPGARRKLLDGLWERATAMMDVARVTCDPKDEAYFKSKASVTTQPMVGGFLAASKDGKQQVDLRIETLLLDMKERRTELVAKALFGGTR